MDNDAESNILTLFLPVRALFKVNLYLKETEEIVICLAEKSVRNRRQMHPIVLRFLHHQFKDKNSIFYGESIIEIYTEYKRDGIIFWAHPNYNSFGEWYDWVMLDFTPPDDDPHYPVNGENGYYDQNWYPAKILCFLKAPDDSIHAVVHCCSANDHAEDSILIECWKKEYDVKNGKFVPLLHCVNVDCFAAPCFVVEDKHGLHEDMGNNVRKILNGVTLVKPRDEAWPAEFWKMS